MTTPDSLTATVRIHLAEIIGQTLEDFLDILDERAWPDRMVGGISYKVTAVEPDNILVISVSGEEFDV